MKFLRTILPLVFIGLIITPRQASSQIIINEVSQGPSGSQEYVEFLVVGAPCSSSCLDLRLWVFDDNNGYLNGGPTTGVGIAAGACRFANDAFWSCIPSGTHITIYNDADPNPSVPPNDISMVDGNCSLIIPIGSALFEHHPSEPSSSSSAYIGTGWLAGGDWADISMANGQDGFQIFDPANLVTPVFSIGWGPINNNGDIYMGAGSATDDVFYADNGVDCDFTIQGNWVEGCAGDLGACGSDDETPGTANSAGNAACISQFNGNCASTGPLVIDTIIPVNVNCSGGGCNGTATASVSGGVAPYTFLWSDPSAQTDSVAVSLCAGTYTVTLTDATGCVDTLDSVVISGGLEVMSAITGSTNIPCGGGCIGTATVTAASGLPPYTYVWNDPGTQTTAVATGLCAGSFEVIVIDASGCDDTSNVVISEASSVTSAITASVNPLCFGACTGSATVTAVGGTPPYTYAWNDPSFQTTITAIALCAGTYIVTITDLSGCIDTSLIVINGPAAMVLATGTASATCGTADGQGWVSVTGGSGPYTYLWDDLSSQTTDTAMALFAGSYTVVVTDILNCIDSVTVNVVDLSGFAIQSTGTNNVSCNGMGDGEATVSVSGGSTPYTFLWDAGTGNQTDSVAINLGPGTYSVTITENGGCVVSAVVTITQPAVIVLGVSGSDANCGVPNGSVTATIFGGTLPYTYLWDDPLAQTTSQAVNLDSGTYSVSIVDSNGCSDNGQVTISQSAGGFAEVLNPIVDATCFGICDGSILVSMNGGTSPFSYLWTDGQATSAATALCAGIYEVTVTDANGCQAILDSFITEPPQILLSGSGTPASCDGTCNGTASIFVSGTNTPYSYLWDVATGNQTSSVATALCQGGYGVTVTDANGCTGVDTSLVPMDSLAPIADYISSLDTAGLLYSSIDFLNLSLPDLDSMFYQWDFGDGDSDTVVHPTHIYLDTGVFQVQLIVTNRSGCKDTIWYTVLIEDEYILFAPNSFSPNGDGINDFFFPQGVGIDEQGFTMYIYNRWGDQIFVTNDKLAQWDGRANGGAEVAQEDVYVWTIQARERGTGKKHSYVGHVTIVR